LTGKSISRQPVTKITEEQAIVICGTFGIITDREQALGPILLEAGKRVAYRGYDSVGCATVPSDGTIDLRKGVGRIQDVGDSLDFLAMAGCHGIPQLRWATFGGIPAS